MSPTPPTLNPSQTVERIREIIVGRHLERLEGRVARLETSRTPENHDASIFEDRLLIAEAKVEALEDHVHRLGTARDNPEEWQEEAQRLSARINEISRSKDESAALAAVGGMERKLGAWLTDWQKSIQLTLEKRDRRLLDTVDSDIQSLRKNIESRLSDIESDTRGIVGERLGKIAEAARALAESASAFSPSTSPR